MSLPDLEPWELEALAHTAEELAEAAAIIAKTLRHGLESCHPNDLSTTNREMIEIELGDVSAAVLMMIDLGIVSKLRISEAQAEKLARVGKYLHHIKIDKTVPGEVECGAGFGGDPVYTARVKRARR